MNLYRTYRRLNCKFSPVLEMKIGSFCDIRTCTVSRFVASLDSRNFLGMTGKECFCNNCFKIRALFFTFDDLRVVWYFFMFGYSSKIGRLFLITLKNSEFCRLCVETYGMTFFRLGVCSFRSSFLSRDKALVIPFRINFLG